MSRHAADARVEFARPVGDSAVLLEVADPDHVAAVHAECVRRVEAGELSAVDVVPAARTVLLDGVVDARALALAALQWAVPPVAAGDGPLVQVPVVFDGPDTADVAAQWGVDVDSVVARVLSTEFRSAFCGFAPGFAYLSGLAEGLDVARRSTPRTAVPEGSVGLAGRYAGVYPRASPGGWQLIGTAVGVDLWDPDRVPAALLAPGTRVRFVRAS